MAAVTICSDFGAPKNSIVDFKEQLRSNQSILKEINPEYSLEGLMLQYFGHLMQRADSLEKTLMLGKIEGRRRGTAEDEIVGWHN